MTFIRDSFVYDQIVEHNNYYLILKVNLKVLGCMHVYISPQLADPCCAQSDTVWTRVYLPVHHVREMNIVCGVWQWPWIKGCGYRIMISAYLSIQAPWRLFT